MLLGSICSKIVLFSIPLRDAILNIAVYAGKIAISEFAEFTSTYSVIVPISDLFAVIISTKQLPLISSEFFYIAVILDISSNSSEYNASPVKEPPNSFIEKGTL